MPRSKAQLLTEALYRLQIPQFVFQWTFSNAEVMGPKDEDYFPAYEARRREREEVAQQELNEMSDLELFELLEEVGRLEEFSSRHWLDFNPPWYSAGFGTRPLLDYSYWAKLSFWTLHETVCLSIGFSPRDLQESLEPSSDIRNFVSEPMDYFWSRRELIRRVLPSLGPDGNTIVPARFVAWARKLPLEVPQRLLDHFQIESSGKRPEMLTTIDARRYESVTKILLASMAAWFGYSGDKIPPDAASEIKRGLEKLGLSMDPKTIKKTLGEAHAALAPLLEEQRRRDDSE
jgi:hypothetical protein